MEAPEEDKETRWWAWILAILLLLLLLGAGLWYFFGRPETPVTNPTPSPTAGPTTGTPPTSAPPTTPPVVTPSVVIGTIAIPDIIGKTAEEADQILRDAGFTKVTFSSGDPNEPVQVLGEWKVTGQSPGAGEQVTPDTEIVITVEKIPDGKG